MTKITDLSGDLVGEILSRVPQTSLKAVRSTCKTWNALSRNLILGQKAAARKNQFLEFMVMDFRVCSLRLDLQGVPNDKDDKEFIDLSRKQISIPNHQVEISQVYHCNGLLLCVPKDEDHSRLLVWNPYLGQTRFIQTVNKFYKFDAYALGYDKNNNHNHKILRLFDDKDKKKVAEIYNFSSDSWRVLDVIPDLYEYNYDYNGVSLKGNTYFFCNEETEDTEDYLVCFDFTRERFGPRLPLPFHPAYLGLETATRSWVRDEKLVVLHHHDDMPEIIEIWIATEIEHNAVSWSSFFKLDMRLTNGLPDGIPNYIGPMSFFIEEEKKVALLFYLQQTASCFNQMAYIFGEDGYFKSVHIGLVSNYRWSPGRLLCSSYVPSLVQLQD